MTTEAGHAGNGTELPPILIVDDEKDDMFILERNLRKAGCRHPILTFDDGSSLLEYLDGNTGTEAAGNVVPALVFLDIKMPALSGLDALASVRAHPKLNSLRAVMVTGSNHPFDKQRAQELGTLAYLEKFPDSEALATVLAMLGPTVPAV
jgi:two-component system, response regulator